MKWNDRTSLIVMKQGPNGLVPATESEVGLGVDAWQADRAMRAWGAGPGNLGTPMSDIHTPAQRRQADMAEAGRLGQPVVTSTMEAAAAAAQGGACPPAFSQTYQAPGVQGSCRLEKQGVSEVGLHTNGTGTTTATSTTVQVKRAATIRRLAAYGMGGLDNYLLSHFDVDQDQLIHSSGRLIPASVFSPKAAFPVAFNLGVGTSDNIRIDSQELVSTASIRDRSLSVSGVNVFVGGGFPSGAFAPLPAMGRRSRQIVLGLTSTAGGTSVAENGGTSTISGSPAVPIRLGALVLTAVWSGGPNITAGNTAVVSDSGYSASSSAKLNCVSALNALTVSTINVNGISIFTQLAAASGTDQSIPAYNFHAESNVLYAPNSIVTPSDTLNIGLINQTTTAAAGTANTIACVGAFVGCERLAVC
jgi:hypothetical protein